MIWNKPQATQCNTDIINALKLNLTHIYYCTNYFVSRIFLRFLVPQYIMASNNCEENMKWKNQSKQ